MTNDSYLWDRSGPKDAFVAKLERLLAARREEIKRAARRRRSVLRVIGPVAMVAVAAAAIVLWVRCFGGGDAAVPAKGGDDRPAAMETPATGAATDAGDALADTGVEQEAATERGSGKSGAAAATANPSGSPEPAEPAAPATMR